MNKLDILKFEYNLIKDKMMLFSASTGGSFFALINSSHNIIIKVILYIIVAISFGGVLVNLHKSGKISKELQKLKEKND